MLTKSELCATEPLVAQCSGLPSLSYSQAEVKYSGHIVSNASQA